jgi:hypothetical protein
MTDLSWMKDITPIGMLLIVIVLLVYLMISYIKKDKVNGKSLGTLAPLYERILVLETKISTVDKLEVKVDIALRCIETIQTDIKQLIGSK